MNKHILLFVIFIPFFCMSQNWAENDAVWYYNQMQFGPETNDDYHKYYANGDTVISGDTAKIVIHEYHTISDTASSKLIMKSESKRVFLFDSLQNSFKLIYDFNALPGDTISVFCHNAQQDTTISVLIDSVSTIDINGNILAVQHVTSLQNQVFYMNGNIIENIGWTGYMFPLHSSYDPPSGGSLRCYEDSITGLYKLSAFECDYINAINNVSLKSKIEVFPNPSEGIINIESDQEIEKIELYNLQGNYIKTTKKLYFNLYDLSSAEYILKIYLRSGNILEKKVIVNRDK